MKQKADEYHGIRNNQLYQSLQCTHHTKHCNKTYHLLTKSVALEVSHALISPLKTLAPSNMDDYVYDL
jgi:hypothetical protein